MTLGEPYSMKDFGNVWMVAFSMYNLNGVNEESVIGFSLGDFGTGKLKNYFGVGNTNLVLNEEKYKAMVKDGVLAHINPFQNDSGTGLGPVMGLFLTMPITIGGRDDSNPPPNDTTPVGTVLPVPNLVSHPTKVTINHLTFNDLNNTDVVSKLYTQTINFSIPIGTYQANDLSELLSQKLESVKTNAPSVSSKITNNYQLSFNPILKTTRQLRKELWKVNDNNDDPRPEFFSPYRTGNMKFQFVTSNDGALNNNQDVNYVLGASQFGILYDESEDKMSIGQIHAHLYDSTPDSTNNNPQVRVIPTQDGLSYVDRCCGLFITGMNPPNFWYGPNSSLKLNRNILCTPRQVQGVRADGVKEIYEYVDLVVGQNCTADELTIDNLLSKERPKSPVNSGFDIAKNTLTEIKSSVMGIGIPIKAGNTLNPSNDVVAIKSQGGYFKLEVGIPNIHQDVRESNRINNNIQAIISRFYHDGNYTTSYDEGSIPIVYNSETPTMVTEFRVRILEPNGQLSNPIGNTSTIFIEIDKNN